MASELGVQTIQHTNGTDAMTIDSSGRVVIAQRPYVDLDFGGGGGSYETMSVGRMQFDNVADGDSSLLSTTNWEFTCPVDGLYLVCHSGLVASAQTHEIQVFKNSNMQMRFFSDGRTNAGVIILSCSANDTIHWINNHGADYYSGSTTSRYTFGTIGLVR